MISDARAHPSVADEDTSDTDVRPEDSTAEGTATTRPGRRRAKRAEPEPAAVPEAEEDAPRRRAAVPLVPLLAVLLVLLLAAAGFLWFTRSEPSSVTTADYVQVLQEARADVVDFTSFDYLTLDDDIRQIRRIAVGDLAEEAADRLDGDRQEITAAEGVASTEIVAAGVTRADAENATVVMVIQTTRRTNESEQARVTKYRIEVELVKSGDRWLLSRISGV